MSESINNYRYDLDAITILMLYHVSDKPQPGLQNIALTINRTKSITYSQLFIYHIPYFYY